MSTSRSRRAQSTIEFTLVTSFMFLVFTVLFLLVANMSISSQEAKQAKDLETLADAIKEEVSLATAVENGYVRTVELPKTIEGTPYYVYVMTSVSLNYTEMILGFNNTRKQLVVPLPVMVTGNLSPGRVTIAKHNGTIVLTPIPG
ncbi:MAG: hypothetical protein V1735_00935 [Nanoarchaeota archaeon]